MPAESNNSSAACGCSQASRKTSNTTCGSCSNVFKENDAGVQCDLCQIWFHSKTKCSGATKELIEFLNSPAGLLASVHWYCRICEQGSKKLFEQMVLIDNRLNKVETQVNSISDKLEAHVTSINKKLDSVLSQPKSVDPPIIDDSMITTIVREIKERENRSLNVVFTGNASEDKVKLYLDRVGVAPKQIKKIGKPETSVYLVELFDVGAKKKMLSEARTLCTSITDFENLYVNPDLTRTEREAQFKLREECRRRRLNGEDVKISKGQVVIVKSM